MKATHPPVPNLVQPLPMIKPAWDDSSVIINAIATPLNNPANPIGAGIENPWDKSLGKVSVYNPLGQR